MIKLKFEEFKNKVYCVGSLNSFAPTAPDNFGIKVQNTPVHNREEIEYFLKSNFQIKGEVIFNHCCRTNPKDYLLSGFIEFDKPEVKEENFNRDCELVNNEYILEEFTKLEIELKSRFKMLDFELLIIENFTEYIRYGV